MERGRFGWPKAEDEKVLLSHHELTLLLDGIDLAATRRRPWHRVSSGVEKKTA
ncbi:MAG: IS66 family insertion sequence element accessory protein TnpB [Bryobacteraceae bacterium]